MAYLRKNTIKVQNASSELSLTDSLDSLSDDDIASVHTKYKSILISIILDPKHPKKIRLPITCFGIQKSKKIILIISTLFIELSSKLILLT